MSDMISHIVSGVSGLPKYQAWLPGQCNVTSYNSLPPWRSERLLVPDPLISHLARDAPSASELLKHHVCDVMLRNVLVFDVCLNTTQVTGIW